MPAMSLWRRLRWFPPSCCACAVPVTGRAPPDIANPNETARVGVHKFPNRAGKRVCLERNPIHLTACNLG